MVQQLAEKVYNARRAYRIRHYDEPELILLVPQGLRDLVLIDPDIKRWGIVKADLDTITIFGAGVVWATNVSEPFVMAAIPQA